MYRTELEPLPLNTRGAQRLWMLVVAVLSFGAGAATVTYVNQRVPFAATAGPATTAPAVAPRTVVPDTLWRPPVPATGSVYHGLPERTAPASNVAPILGCVWSPPLPASGSIYGADCLVPAPRSGPSTP